MKGFGARVSFGRHMGPSASAEVMASEHSTSSSHMHRTASMNACVLAHWSMDATKMYLGTRVNMIKEHERTGAWVAKMVQKR